MCFFIKTVVCINYETKPVQDENLFDFIQKNILKKNSTFNNVYIFEIFLVNVQQFCYNFCGMQK